MDEQSANTSFKYDGWGM